MTARHQELGVMALSLSDLGRIGALADTLLPGGAGFPAASTVGLGGWIVARDEYASAVMRILELLSANFETLAPWQREVELRLLETSHKNAFEAFVSAAYAGYYTSLPVLAVIEEATGYHARPQPFGYALAPFDDAIVSVSSKSPRSWRDTPPA